MRLLSILGMIVLGFGLLGCDGDNGPTPPESDEINYILTRIVFRPSSISPGGNLVIYEYKVENAGSSDDTTSSLTIGFYLSTDAEISTSDILLSRLKTISGLNAGEEYIDSVTVGVPLDTPPDTYYVGICIDGGNDIAETDETDNCGKAGTTLAVEGANYISTRIVFTPPSVSAGGSLNYYEYKVKNIGSGDDLSSSVTIGFYLSTDEEISTSDILLGTESINGLIAGEEYTGHDKVVTIPVGTNPGTYYVGIYPDADSDVFETDEEDNGDKAGETLTVN